MSDISDLKAEVLALRAENAELRKHVRMPDEPLEIDEKDFYVRAFIKWATEEQPEIKRLAAENAKLRELVRDAWGNGHPDKSCGDCEIMDECHAEIEEAHKKGNGRWNTRCLFERRIEERMRELGVEVDA